MKIGILGGTFDPVHYGHLLLAEICRQELSLDQVRLIPAGHPPHKPRQQITDGYARADMLSLAVAGYPEFIVDRREVRRIGPSYTVDTLTELSSEYPEAELYFLMGADSVHNILTWREPHRIAELAYLVGCNRPDCEKLTMPEVRQQLGDLLAARVTLISIPGIDLSATDLRRRIRDGLGLRFMTPRAVETYILQHRLYH